MRKKLTITLDADVYQGLHAVAGARKIGRFIEDKIRPHVLQPNLEHEYAEMARDEGQEREALEWAEGVIGDVADEGE
jgi:hypothetical protein